MMALGISAGVDPLVICDDMSDLASTIDTQRPTIGKGLPVWANTVSLNLNRQSVSSFTLASSMMVV